MRELPIIFSGPMVRALLAGTKTQTRRIIKPQPEKISFEESKKIWMYPLDKCGPIAPYKPGDRLYVRENLLLWPGHAEYEAGLDGLSWVKESNELTEFLDTYKRAKVPSIHMPKWAARIWLTVTDVRVQRVQDISEDDAKAEGCPEELGSEFCFDGMSVTRAWFMCLWKAIHGIDAWDENPWVWCYSFSVDKRA